MNDTNRFEAWLRTEVAKEWEYGDGTPIGQDAVNFITKVDDLRAFKARVNDNDAWEKMAKEAITLSESLAEEVIDLRAFKASVPWDDLSSSMSDEYDWEAFERATAWINKNQP